MISVLVENAKTHGRKLVRLVLRIPIRGRTRIREWVTPGLMPEGGMELRKIGSCEVPLDHTKEATRNMAYGVYETAELKVLCKHLRHGDIVFDVGANVGYLSAHFVRLVGPRGQVFAFEPGATPFAFLRRVQESDSEHVLEVFQVAVSDCEGHGVFWETEDILRKGYGRLDKRPSDRFTDVRKQLVKTISLDGFLAERRLDPRRVRLVKVDVEGHEDKVFSGMSGFFSEGCRPLILAELSEAAGQEYPEYLQSLGYSAHTCRNGSLKQYNLSSLPKDFHGNLLWTHPAAVG